MAISFAHLMRIVACILFVIAALASGAVLGDTPYWPFAFGGFAAWVISPLPVVP